MFIKPLSVSDFDRLSHLIENSFCNNPSWAPSRQWITHLINHANLVINPVLEQGLSIAALDDATNDYMGMILLNLHDKDNPSEANFAFQNFQEKLGEKVAVPFAVANDLYRNLDLFDLFNTTKYVVINFLSVDEKHGRKGVGQTLVSEALKVAEKIGVNLVSALSVSRSSQRTLEKEGFSIIREVEYEAYKGYKEDRFTMEMLQRYSTTKMLIMCRKINVVSTSTT